ncbi:hypothetical protein BGX24_009089 [Mortierella sp. AD032]|nr:hypothetical protein BGX24_009089 [Mortierella sp. AD032]
MSSHLWLPPEILYHVAEHLNQHQLSRATLVCHAWNNAFAPILWANIQLAYWKTHASPSPLPLETLQARAPWMRSLTFNGHADPTQFKLGHECRFLRSLTLSVTIPFDPSRGFDKAYSDRCRELIRQNRTSLRHLELEGTTFDTHKHDPGMPNWSPVAIFAFGKHTALRSLKVTRCHLHGQHKEAFWTLCERLEVLEIDGGWYGLPDERSRRQTRCKATATIILDTREDWIKFKRFPRLINLKLVSLTEKTSEEYLRSIAAQCPRLRRLGWNDRGTGTSLVHSLLNYLTLPELRAKTWPDLESIEMPSVFRVENILRVIESWPIGKLHNTGVLLRSVPGHYAERLLELHSNSLREVDLSQLEEASQKWMHRFLELCPSLERVKCQTIDIQPLVDEDRPPWVCDRLQEWEMYVDMDPRSFFPPRNLDHPLEQQEEWCRKVLERLGRLRQLRVLDMRMKSAWRRNGVCFGARTESQLHLSLRMGLGELGRLYKLKEVYFQGQQKLMRRNDVRWMVEHWINLEKIQGNTFSTRREVFAGRKNVWDWGYCRMFGEYHVKAGSESPCYPSDYLNPKHIR